MANMQPSNMVMQYEEKQRLTAPTKVQCLSFSTDGTLLACGAANLIRVWWTSDGREVYNFVAVTGVMSIQWGEKRTLYCGLASGDLLIKIFDEDNVSTMGLQASKKPIAYIALDGSEKTLALGGDDEVSIWTLDDDAHFTTIPQWKFVKKLPNPPAQSDWITRITSVAWSPIEQPSLVVSYLHHGVVTWNVETERRLSGITLNQVSQGTLSPNGRYFLVSTRNQTFDLYTVGSSIHARSFVDEDLVPGPPRTNPAIFVHDGQWLLGGGTGKATLWHVATGRQFQSLTIPGLADPVTTLAASKSMPTPGDDNFLYQVATVVGERLIVVWRARPLLDRNVSEAEGLFSDGPDISPETPNQPSEEIAPSTISYSEWAMVLCLVVGTIYCSQRSN